MSTLDRPIEDDDISHDSDAYRRWKGTDTIAPKSKQEEVLGKDPHPTAGLDAAGPDTFEYREFLDILSKGMGRRNILIPIPDWLTLMVGQFRGLLLQDIVITEAEIRGLRQGLAASSEEPLGTTSFRDWAKENGDDLGRIYRNDIKTRKYVK